MPTALLIAALVAGGSAGPPKVDGQSPPACAPTFGLAFGALLGGIAGCAGGLAYLMASGRVPMSQSDGVMLGLSTAVGAGVGGAAFGIAAAAGEQPESNVDHPY